MLTTAEHEAAWMVELHPLGGSQIRQVRDVMRSHQELLMEGKRPEWVAVALRPTFDEAKKELKRIRKEMRERRSSGGDSSADFAD